MRHFWYGVYDMFWGGQPWWTRLMLCIIPFLVVFCVHLRFYNKGLHQETIRIRQEIRDIERERQHHNTEVQPHVGGQSAVEVLLCPYCYQNDRDEYVTQLPAGGGGCWCSKCGFVKSEDVMVVKRVLPMIKIEACDPTCRCWGRGSPGCCCGAWHDQCPCQHGCECGPVQLPTGR